jgi:ferritin-like metal-binding protein YciE
MSVTLSRMRGLQAGVTRKQRRKTKQWLTNELKGLLEDEIKDLYSAEKQLTKAIPKMAKGAHSAALSTAFTKHLKEPHEQVIRFVGAGSRVEHYEMAGYTTAIGLAERIGASKLLEG